MNIKDISLASGLILLAFLSRFIPHAPNFTPVLAVAIFSGAVFKNRWAAYSVPFLALALSNIFLSYSFSSVSTMLICAALVLFGRGKLDKKWGWLSSALSASLVFFIASNFFVWWQGFLYPQTWEGLVSCYVAAIPFFQNTLLSTVLYSSLLFGVFNFLRHKKSDRALPVSSSSSSSS